MNRKNKKRAVARAGAVPCQLSSCRRVKCRLFAAELCSVELRVRRLLLGRCKYCICYTVNGTLSSTCYLIRSFPKLETIPSAAFAAVSLALVAAPREPTEQVGRVGRRGKRQPTSVCGFALGVGGCCLAKRCPMG